MELEPSVSLAGHHADFIALDGSVSLRLDLDDASETVEGAKRTLTWNVCTQPWESGDLLVLRISSSGEGLTGVTNDGQCSRAAVRVVELHADPGADQHADSGANEHADPGRRPTRQPPRRKSLECPSTSTRRGAPRFG